jgi:phage-related protein
MQRKASVIASGSEGNCVYINTGNHELLIDVGMNIMQSLITGILDAIPKLLAAAPTIIGNLADTLLDNLPTVIERGMDIQMALVDGIASALPALVDAATGIISKLLESLLSHLPQLLATGAKLVLKLAAGIIQAIPNVISAVLKLAFMIPKAIMQTDWIKVGKNIIKGIVKGLKDAGHMVADFLLDLMGGAVKKVKNFFGIKSPSRKMRKEVGFQVGAGMALGIKDSASMVEDAMESLTSIPSTGKFKMDDFDITGSSTSGSMNSGVGNQTYIINVNQPVSTPDEMARAIRLESQYGLLEGGAI